MPSRRPRYHHGRSPGKSVIVPPSKGGGKAGPSGSGGQNRWGDDPPTDPAGNPLLDWLTEWVKGGASEVLVESKFVQFRTMVTDAMGLILLMQRPGFRADAANVMRAMSSALRQVDFDEFRTAWAVARQMTGLQGRLLSEQVFWTMGDPWRSLYTGFKPVGDEASASRLVMPSVSVLAEKQQKIPNASVVKTVRNTSGAVRPPRNLRGPRRV